MKQSIFDPAIQHSDVNRKTVVALERISEVFRSLLWDHVKVIGLSPIQIQLLIFIGYHDEELCNVSHLAKEFQVTKPTISDAIRVLLKKELIEKRVSDTDRRAYSVVLKPKGEQIKQQTENFADPVLSILNQLPFEERRSLFNALSRIIYGMNQTGMLSVQRMCFRCRFYQKEGEGHYCRLLQVKLADEDIRLDCPEFVER
ncbi:MAG: helix-turn-helix domain-containing protein [Saprospiraceae bacterium]